MLIKIVKQPVFNSFSLIADRLNAEFNKLKDVYSIYIDFTHKSLGKSDFTILIQAFDVLLNYKIDKEGWDYSMHGHIRYRYGRGEGCRRTK